MSAPPATLAAQLASFVRILRRDHAFGVGHAQARDALVAFESVGIRERRRARAALRAICCSSPEEIVAFERAFEAFFTAGRDGALQPELPRRARPGGDDAGAAAERSGGAPGDDVAGEDAAAGGRSRVLDGENDDPDAAGSTAYARYSPQAARAPSPRPAFAERDAMLAAAVRLIAAARLGRSRRLRAQARGDRIDARRTVRTSLRTAGEPLRVRYLGRPARNPRFVLLIDGSASMAEYVRPAIDLAMALLARSPRTRAFAFSTDVRDVTRMLRAAAGGAASEFDLGEAWGGGTRIGASLAEFVHRFGARSLGEDTVVAIVSDGFDVGEIAVLEGALRSIAARSAAIVWLNPHAGSPGFSPTARGMRAALPFVDCIAPLTRASDVDALARRLRRTLARSGG